MAWYHDEANKQNALEQEKDHKQRIIQQSNFWSDLRRQIEQDVAGINDTDFWKKRLGGHPLTVQYAARGENYAIRKATYPAITITLSHLGDYVEVERDFASHEGVEQFETSEQLTIGSDGRQVYLLAGNTRLAVPEQAAQYILSPIIESLKTTRPPA